MISTSLRPLARLNVFEEVLQHLRVEDQRLQVVTHRLDVDVLVDEFDRLGPQGVPEQFAVAAGRLHRFIDLRQPAVVLLVGAEARIGRERLPDGAEHGVLGGELVPRLVVGQALLRGHQTLVAAHGAVHAGEERQALLHLHGEGLAQLIDVADHLLHGLFVEVQGPGHVVEDADVVHDQAVGLRPGRRCGWSGRWPAGGCGPSSACRDTSPAGWARRSRSAAWR